MKKSVKNIISFFESHTLFFIITVSFILRLGIILANRSFRLDDVLIINQAKLPLVDILQARYGDFNIHGPLQYILLHFLLKVHDSDWILRIPSVFFSTILIFPFYKIVELLFSKKIALISGLIAGFSMYNMEFAGQVKNYPMLMFFGLWYFYYYLLYIFDSKTKSVVLCIIFGILALWTDYSFIWMAAISLSISIYLYIQRNTLRPLGIIFISLFIIGTSYIYYWPIFFRSLNNAVEMQFSWRPPATVSTLISFLEYYTFGAIGHFVISDTIIKSLGLFAFLMLFIRTVASNDAQKKFRNSMTILIIWLLLPLLSVLLVSRFLLGGKSILADYNLMIVAYAWFVGFAIVASKNKQIQVIFFSLYFISNMYIYALYVSNSEIYGMKDWRGLAYKSQSVIDLNTNLFFIGLLEDPFMYYYQKFPQAYTLETRSYIRNINEQEIFNTINDKQNKCLIVNTADIPKYQNIIDILTRKKEYIALRSQQLVMYCLGVSI